MKNSQIKSSFAAFLALLMGMPVSLVAQNNYSSFELTLENPFEPLVTEDLDGDGAAELIVSRYQPDIGRELHIYKQLSNGSFASTPQRIEIKTEIIAVGFADLRPEPGKELLLYASNGIFSLSTAIEGYAGNIKQLLSWDLAAAIPEQKSVQFVNDLSDVTGDGLVDLLLPGQEKYGFFRGEVDEAFSKLTEFSTINKNITAAQRPSRSDDDLDFRLEISAEKGVVVEITAPAPSPFKDLIEQWSANQSGHDVLMQTEMWMPSARFAQLNDDNRKDIVYINQDDDLRGQFNVHFQKEDGSFSASPDWQAPLDTQGELQLAQLNDDNQIDLIKVNGDGNDWSVSLYSNHNGKFNFEQADQVMRFSGYDLEITVDSAIGGVGPVLNASYYTVPVVDVIRNASIVRTQLLFKSTTASTTGDQKLLFSRRPDSSLEDSFSAENIRALSGQMSLKYDVDGDGINDALYITDDGTLAAKKIGKDLRIANQPFWRYVPMRTVLGFWVENLNADDKPDLVITHNLTRTVLVARP